MSTLSKAGCGATVYSRVAKTPFLTLIGKGSIGQNGIGLSTNINWGGHVYGR